MLRLWLLLCCSTLFVACFAKPEPWVMRISCGSRVDVHTPPTNTLWHKDFAYTGGIPTNSTSKTRNIAPPLSTLRYFPLSEGPNNCYNIKRVPKGHYSVRVFYALVAHHDPNSNIDNEPLFDISIEGTQIYSLQSGWSSHDDQVFTEARVFLTDGTSSICFHSTGHGDPTILSIEILQVDDRSYYFGPGWAQGIILRTTNRFSCGNGKSKFDADYSGDRWGGDRFWSSLPTFNTGSDKAISTERSIQKASNAPNFYPEALYQTALVSTNTQLDLTFSMDVDPNKNYSIWLHFAEIDASITGVGKRIFDVMINGDVVFEAVDVAKMSGDRYAALLLNTTVAVNGRTLMITLRPRKGSYAIINAIEVFEIITTESKTLLDEVRGLQKLKSALSLPPRLGWNGDPCVPQQHPWSGADCQFDRTSHKWAIEGLHLDNQGLKGFLPNDMSMLRHLQTVNLSSNSIHGAIPSSIGSITSLEVLDFSYNFFNGSIPVSIGQLTSLRRLYLNSNSLSGKVPNELGGRLLHGASFNFTDNAGLCGIPGLRGCGPHISAGTKIGMAFGVLVGFLLMVMCSMCWWKRRQNVLRVQQITARGAPYAKSRTLNAHDIQMTRQYSYGRTRTASDNGPNLLS